MAGTGSKQFLVLDDMHGNVKEGTEYDGIGKGTVVFTADSKRWAYVAGAESKQFAVVDGQEGKHYDGIGRNSLVFSPDGKHVVYAATEGNKQFTVLDGNEGEQYDIAGKGGVMFDSANTFHYLAVNNNLNLKLGDTYVVEHRIK